MPTFDIVRASLSDYYRMIQANVHQLTAPLSSEQLWVRPYPYGNSIGNLILHLTGNLNYYIGSQIGGSGYVRHRDLEFSDTGQPKETLLKDFDQAIEIVRNDHCQAVRRGLGGAILSRNLAGMQNPLRRDLQLRSPHLPPCRPDYLSAEGIAGWRTGRAIARWPVM